MKIAAEPRAENEDLLIKTYIKRSKKYVRKDYVHTFFTGLALFIITVFVGYFSDNKEQRFYAILLGAVFFVIFVIRAWYEKRAGFYLVKSNSRTKHSIPYLRNIGGYTYYYSFIPRTFYCCRYDGSFRKLNTGRPFEYRTDPKFYSDLGDSGDVFLLLSPTQTLLGCFTNDGGFVKNY